MSHAGGETIVSKPRYQWTADITPEIKDYFQKKGMSAAECFRDLYARHKREELPEALKELTRLENLVSQQRLFVTQLQHECVTKQAKCDTENMDSTQNWLNDQFNPGFYLGKQYNGITITQEMVDKARVEKRGEVD